jgi:transposase
MPTVPVSGRADLSDAQWAVLEPLLPRGKKPGRPRKWELRRLVDGIRWRTRAGRRGGMSRRGTGRGSRCTGCSGAGSGPGLGRGS